MGSTRYILILQKSFVCELLSRVLCIPHGCRVHTSAQAAQHTSGLLVFPWHRIVMDGKIQILSKGAHRNGRMATLQALMTWLSEQGVPTNDIYLFIVSPERRQYRAQNFGCHLISGKLGCGAQKNFAAKYMHSLFGSDVLVLHFDDDVVSLQRARPDDKYDALPLPSQGLRSLVAKALRDMRSHGAQLFSVNMSLNPLNRYARGSPPMTSLGLVIGMFYGYLTHNDPELYNKFCIPQGFCEDYERSLRYYLRHGVVLRYADYTIDCAVVPGGPDNAIASTVSGSHNRVVGSVSAARKLSRAFPNFCKVEKTYAKQHGKKNAVFLPHFKKRQHGTAPSCMCGSCCLCNRRDGVLQYSDAKLQNMWCRSCRNKQREQCSRRRCKQLQRCSGSHCMCAREHCICRNQAGCPLA